MKPVKTMNAGGKAVVMQKGQKFATFKPGYNYTKKLG